MKIKQVIEVEVDPEELWTEVFGSGYETWPWWNMVTFSEGDWETPGVAWLSIIDPDDYDSQPVVASVNMDRLVWAYEQAIATCVDACTGKPIYPGSDIDACVGDCILQIAVQGEVVYG